jgi:heme exporter protein A
MRLTVSNLGAVRGGRRVLADISFRLAPGEVLAVTGPNGAGKSTLLRLIAGLLTASAGSIAFEPSPEDNAIHYLGHLDGLKTALTVRENLAFWAALWGGGDVIAALEQVGLAHLAPLPVGVLSAGQRRRAAIARLLLAPRPLWLLDEPATALDTEAEATLGRIVGAHLDGGGMAVIATHRALPLATTATLALGAA